MSFWEKHRTALTVGGAILFIFLLVHLAWARGAARDEEAHREKIKAIRREMGAMYLEIKDPRGVFNPRLAEVRKGCQDRKDEYEGQLKDLTRRLRFPFKKDFPWVDVPKNAKGQPLQISGVYLAQRYQVVAENVDKYRVNNPKGSHTKLAEKWLGFKPEARPDTVTLAQAEEELRKLALADRITKLAIDQGVSWVLKVKPETISYDAAYGWQLTKVRGRPEKVWGPYRHNRFIKNYPVSIKVIGSVDAVMKFFHSVRGQRHFLVIRAFKMVSADAGSVSVDHREMMRPGEVLVTISAACMDFADPTKQKKVKKPTYVPRTTATGA